MFGSNRARDKDGRQSSASSFSNSEHRGQQMCSSSSARALGSEELKRRISQAIQNWYAPDAVLIDANWQIL